MFARYPRSLNSARRDARAPAVSSLDRVYRPVSLSLGERRLLEITKIVSPRTKDRKRFFFSISFFFFSRGGGSSLSGPRPLIPSRDSRVSRENSLWPRLIANGTKGTSFMGHITDSTKGRMMKRIGGKAEGPFVCSRVPPVQRVFFFFFNRGEKGNSGGWHSATTSGALMGVNAMCKRAIAPTALFCSPLPSFSLVRPIHPPGNSMPLTCPVAAGKKKGGAGGGRAIEEGRRQGWRGARTTTRAQEVSPLSG